MRNAEAGRNRFRVVEILEGAAATEGRAGALGHVVKLHRHADDLAPLLREQRRRHRGVDASGHGHDDSHPLSIDPVRVAFQDPPRKRSSARRAASCWAVFFEKPSPSVTRPSSSLHSIRNRRWWLGPSSAATT